MRAIRLRPCESADAAFLQALLGTDDAACLPRLPPLSPIRDWVLNEYCGPSSNHQVIIADRGGRPVAAFVVHALDWRNLKLEAVLLLANSSAIMAREAVRTFADDVFRRLPVQSIRFQCLVAALQDRILVQSGCEPLVYLRQHTFARGQYADVRLMVLTRDAWMSASK